jgi:hypothetical protein
MRFPFGRNVRRWIADRGSRHAVQPLLEFLDGKSVAIVGNAASLMDHSHGAFIDEHEVVTRMNMGFPIHPEAQGHRFDLWCFSHFRVLHYAPEGFLMPRLVWMSPTFRDKADHGIDCYFYPLADWRALRDRLGSRPSVGAMTIDLVSRSAPRQVTILGFDFKRTDTFYDKGGPPGPHNFAAEARYIADLAARRSWQFVVT